MKQYDKVRSAAVLHLQEEERPTPDRIRDVIRLSMQFTGVSAEEVDADQLRADLEAAFTTYMGRGQFLDGEDDQAHEDWLNDAGARKISGRSPLEWKFWRRYRQYLLDHKHWPPKVVDNVDDTTTKILQRLEDPERTGRWDRRGMVVGAVQSGKTANFTGVICKAADAGYKVIIVLAGMHNNLRSQTQARLDQEFFGQDSDRSRAYEEQNQSIGVARVPGMGKPPRVHTFTSSNDKGDFNAKVASNLGFQPGGDPVFLVVKKHAGILRNLTRWFRTVQDYDPDRKKVQGLPLLVIDDECDQASINTKFVDPNDPDYDVTAINKRIRELLNLFDQSSYIGYTATPFANVFIDPDTLHDAIGDDLFPRHFILNLPRPSTYVGPARVFGLAPDPVTGDPGRDPQPVVVPIGDSEALIPGRHRQDLFVPDLPASLRRAVRAFVLSTALRRTRGQRDVHNTMLVHVSRFNAVQARIAHLLSQEIQEMQAFLQYNDRSGQRDNLLEELRQQWAEDYVPITRAMAPQQQLPDWPEVREEILTVVPRVGIKIINGLAGDVLDYANHKDGLHTIAVGGDKLSRGLTLEGLTVSYYLRAASMFDTLMQMGRWFGYRPNYEDLCRIYTTHEIVDLYRWIAMAEEELREDFDEMVRLGRTPNDFGLKVRRHPGGTLITNMTKQRNGRRMELTYADDVPQTFTLDLRPETVHANLEAANRFIRGLGKPGKPPRDDNALYWGNVPAEHILDFLGRYELDDRIKGRITTPLLRQYIEQQTARGKLLTWAVALANPQNGTPYAEGIGGHDVRLVKRKTETGVDHANKKVTLNTVLDRGHEAIDLDRPAYEAALAATRQKHHDDQLAGLAPLDKKEPDQPRPHDIRRQRPAERGLLILYAISPDRSEWTKALEDATRLEITEPVIGWVISFPNDPESTPVAYTVNARFDDDL